MGVRTRNTKAHAKVLDTLGGARAVAERLGVGYHVTLKWRQRGIPSAYWHRIARLNACFSPAYLAATRPEARL
jgi:hypothetical protein